MTKYHIQNWVQRNTPKLVSFAQSLSKPALTVGKGAVSLLIELFTIFVLVLLLLIEAPKMRRWILGQMQPEPQRHGHPDSGRRQPGGHRLHARQPADLAHRRDRGVRDAASILGVPFPFLWGLWVALVDFLPMIGGALAGIPTVLFALATASPRASSPQWSSSSTPRSRTTS